MGKLLVIGGLIMVGLGLLIMTGVPVGRLPGDFSFKRGNVTFYVPLATSIIASLLLTLLLTLLRR
jgi:hypothetical protein